MIEQIADRIAARGYVVLAPNLFYRAGRAPVTEMPDLSDPDARGAFFGEAEADDGRTHPRSRGQ